MLTVTLRVISFGTFAHGDTTGGAEEWEFGDILYVSAATAGALTNVKPAGAANLIQNVGKVERVHASRLDLLWLRVQDELQLLPT